jgi:hypothetical protein
MRYEIWYKSCWVVLDLHNDVERWTLNGCDDDDDDDVAKDGLICLIYVPIVQLFVYKYMY